MEIGIVAQRGNPRAAALAGDIREAVDTDVLLDEATATALDTTGTPVEEMAGCSLLVSIGGDGTFLYTARDADGTPVMGVNLGEVGFLNATAPEEAVGSVTETIASLRDGTATVSELPRLRVSGADLDLPDALNEVVVMGERRGRAGGVDIAVRVDGSTYASGHADGVLVATPTGSTAYNLSEGGPLVHPSVGAFIVTEMAATEPMPPLAVGLDSEISVRISAPETATVISDGRMAQTLDAPVEVRLDRAETPLRIAGPELDFFAALGKLDR